MKIRKTIATLGTIALVAIGTVMPTQAASDTIKGGVANYDITAGSFISSSSGHSYTRASLRAKSSEVPPSVYVSATYSYVRYGTLETGSMSDSKGYVGDATVGFSAPTNCRSVEIGATHSASYSGQTWSGRTHAKD